MSRIDTVVQKPPARQVTPEACHDGLRHGATLGGGGYQKRRSADQRSGRNGPHDRPDRSPPFEWRNCLPCGFTRCRGRLRAALVHSEATGATTPRRHHTSPPLDFRTREAEINHEGLVLPALTQLKE